MGEFRIGRSHAKHSYPDTPRAAVAAYARNFAQGPAALTSIVAGGTQLPWAVIESGAPAGVHVPITPRVTGKIRLIAAITIQSDGEGADIVQVQAQINDITIATPLVQSTVIAGGFGAIPFVLDIPALLPIGSQLDISLLVTDADGGTSLTVQSSTLDIQELPLATG